MGELGFTFTWYGHACVEIVTEAGRHVLFDPWFGNPRSTRSADSIDVCDLLLVTHGHSDHMGDAVALAVPPPARLAVHPRDEPLAGPAPARRRGSGDRHEQGRHGRSGRPQCDHGPCRPLGRRLGARPRRAALPGRAGRLRRRARERATDLLRGRHRCLRRHAAHRRAASARRRLPAHRRPLHDGSARLPRRRSSCSACRPSCPSTTAPSRSWPARPTSSASSSPRAASPRSKSWPRRRAPPRASSASQPRDGSPTGCESARAGQGAGLSSVSG